jgi:hypothetical protein
MNETTFPSLTVVLGENQDHWFKFVAVYYWQTGSWDIQTFRAEAPSVELVFPRRFVESVDQMAARLKDAVNVSRTEDIGGAYRITLWTRRPMMQKLHHPECEGVVIDGEVLPL